jgi:hypothetical protein
MSANKWEFDRKDEIKKALIIFYGIIIFYLSFFIPILYSATSFIILFTILIIRKLPVKYSPLFEVMHNDDLKKFKEYLNSQKLKVTNIHKLEYKQGKTPIIYAMEQKAFKIFKYLVENGYDLKYVSERSEPPIIFSLAADSIKYFNLLLKNKNRLDLYARSKKICANVLEIAIGIELDEQLNIIEALLNAGMKFSIGSYNSTKVAKYTPFKNISMKIKNILMERFFFEKVKKQLNMVNEIDKQKTIKSFNKVNIYWKEYLDFVLEK